MPCKGKGKKKKKKKKRSRTARVTRNMLILLGVLTIISTTGCSLTVVERTVTMPDNKVYKVSMRTDDLVVFEKDGVKITVDGRGRPHWLEGAATMALSNVDFNLSNKEGR